MKKNNLRIVAIGGGELRKLETLPLDKLVVDMTGKTRPKALFLPTATGDSEKYIETFTEVYGRRLGCRITVLRLLSQRPAKQEISEKINEADLVYVGGGNTLRMMKRWRALGVDKELIKAAHKGTVMAGLSAGGICWFRYGESDSRKFSGKAGWKHIRVKGLGLIPFLFCPHYRREKRAKPLADMILHYGGHAIACDDNAAFVVEGDLCRAVTTRPNARVVMLYRDKGTLQRYRINAGGKPIKLCDLLKYQSD
ncbi:MAG: peptidase E [Sedimentisphaerales bacterium]|nr:peptidase E [Sedimentisphaerales bacterium]